MSTNVLPHPPANPSGPGIYEIKVGIFASVPEIIQDVLAGFTEVLSEPEALGLPRVKWDLAFVGPDAQCHPGGDPVEEAYAEVQDSWMMLHPGFDPGDRQLHEVRVGVFGDELQAYQLQAGLMNFLSPTDEAGMPLLGEEDYQWRTWVLSAGAGSDFVQGRILAGDPVAAYLMERHGDLMAAPA